MYGQTVNRRQRIRTDVDGDFIYTYVTKEPIRGQFTQLTATDEAVERWGFFVDADYIATFLPTTEVEEGDLLYLYDAWYEVENFVKRRTRGIVDYKEALLRKKE